MTKSSSKKPARRKSAATDSRPRQRTKETEPKSYFPPNPRKSNRMLLALGAGLFVVWLVLLLLLAMFRQ